MGPMQILATVVALIVTVIAVGLFVRAVRQIVRVVRLGQPVPAARFADKGSRTATMLRETIGHTRMLRWTGIGVAHWFVMVGFGFLFFTLLEAYGEVVNPRFKLPLIGGWSVYALLTEVIAVAGLISIAALIAVRLRNRPQRRRGLSRFTGSTMWQGYYVEWTIAGVMICILAIRALKVAADEFAFPVWAAPVSHALGALLGGLSPGTALNLLSVVALVKILISMAWFVVISLNLAMGVAWHRFAAFPNIWFKRSGSPRPSLGALQPMMSNGKPLDFEEADPEKDAFGVATVEQFTWKGLLDFSTCTERGRCQSQCPSWNTGKPLSPKLLEISQRDHAYAKAPYLLNADTAPAEVKAEADRPLIGWADEAGVID